jgi:hypothetical protein
MIVFDGNTLEFHTTLILQHCSLRVKVSCDTINLHYLSGKLSSVPKYAHTTVESI